MSWKPPAGHLSKLATSPLARYTRYDSASGTQYRQPIRMVSQMVKCLVREKGAPLDIMSVTEPGTIGPTEVTIRLKAIAINPADFKMIDQGHRVTSWPLVPGLDGAGIVEATGNDVTSFTPGDRVLALFAPGDRGGSYQALASVHEKDVAKIPNSWSFEEASTLGVCYLTGIMALGIGLKTPLPFLKDGPMTGFQPSSVLVLGGSSAVGAATIQLLRLALPDCKVLATSSLKHHAYIADVLGAHGTIDRGSAALSHDVKAQTLNSCGVDAIIDAVGAAGMSRHVFDALNPNGPKRYAQVWTGDKEIDVPSGVESVMFRGRDLPQLPGNKNIMQSLQVLLEEGRYKLPLPVHKVGHGFDALERGLELMRRGVSREKLVVTV